MAGTAHVYQIFIAAQPEEVWQAITDSEWTRRYFHTTQFVEGPVAGSRYRTVSADGQDAVDGVVEEMTPPTAGQPGRSSRRGTCSTTRRCPPSPRAAWSGRSRGSARG